MARGVYGVGDAIRSGNGNGLKISVPMGSGWKVTGSGVGDGGNVGVGLSVGLGVLVGIGVNVGVEVGSAGISPGMMVGNCSVGKLHLILAAFTQPSLVGLHAQPFARTVASDRQHLRPGRQ